MIPPFAADARRGELIRPPRFLPAVDWPHEHKAFAFGPWDIGSGNSSPDMSRGNYGTGWVAYLESDGGTYLQKKMPNDLWDDNPRYLLALVGGIKKISLEFSPNGFVIIGYLRPDNAMGVWWRNPDTGLPQLLDLDTDVQDAVLTVENKDDPTGTDVFLWYFKAGSLYLRQYSERFAVAHGPFLSGVTDPVIIQAGINHRYGYQVDYRDNAL
ncbi:hypothetical protein GJQ54_05360 [Oceanospirillaceae bacterium ASx5O]|nr:hypothetical protein GJQ54_05360 [Oceanospirillaceae bacterium ASx5O]